MRKHSHITEILRQMLVLSLPLIFNPGGASAFELPKAVLLRMFILLLLWVTFLTHQERLAPRSRAPPSAMMWAGTAFGAAASLFSYDPQTGFGGARERQQGLLTLIAYLALFRLSSQLLHSWTQIDRLWATLVWGSLPNLGRNQARQFACLPTYTRFCHAGRFPRCRHNRQRLLGKQVISMQTGGQT